MSDITLRSFPANKYEYIISLYLENQDLTDLTPVEILEKYDQAKNELDEHLSENRKQVLKTFKL